MKPEEAIEYLSDGAVCRHLPEEYDWAVDTAKEALEKQISLAVSTEVPCHVKALDVDTMQVVTFSCYPCPSCEKWIHANTNHKYCEHCGQALDWGR